MPGSEFSPVRDTVFIEKTPTREPLPIQIDTASITILIGNNQCIYFRNAEQFKYSSVLDAAQSGKHRPGDMVFIFDPYSDRFAYRLTLLDKGSFTEIE